MTALEDKLARDGIYVGEPQALPFTNTTRRHPMRLSNADPAKPMPTPEEARRKLDKITVAFGFDPPLEDFKVLETELTMLIEAAKAPVAPDAEVVTSLSRYHGLSVREVQTCLEVGADVATYAANKRARKAAGGR